MKRRTFLKSGLNSLVTLSGLSLFGSLGKRALCDDLFQDVASCRIWSYYVPLTSYTGILEVSPTMNPLDRKVVYQEVIKKTDRINGKESDGTKNPESFDLATLEAADESIRIHFWHDDNGEMRPSGHSLYVFKRYLEELGQGKKIFVATGMTLGHCHVVMIQPPTDEDDSDD